ncbi:hypothetical protein HGRIS_013184 [Hohenbuehelia grisea]|uniref:Uncharacterized protein n=1 Tax=Hohenbuehelia grisea TaxID=104357 RepID=A0ABR3IUY6_9AGAR
MPTIVAPQPLRAATSAFLGCAIASPCSWAQPTRLGSPIKLQTPSRESIPRPSLEPFELLSQPSSRRSSKRRDCRSRRAACHRRHCAGKCATRSKPHSFDELPWIAALDAEPSPGADIADLSQLPVAYDSYASGPGPIRRRKISSLRSNPLSLGAPLIAVELFRDVKTPVSHFSGSRATGLPHDLSHVQFHNLMPVLGTGVHDCKEDNALLAAPATIA